MNFVLNTGSLGLDLFINIVLFAVGSYILIKGSDLFVDSAAAIARHWNVSELVIGLTLVSIGTSLPELATSVYAQTLHGDSDFVIGNILGSNVTNITLILGAGILLAGRLNFAENLIKRDLLVMNILFLATVACFAFLRVPGNTEGAGMVWGLPWYIGILLLAAGVWYCTLLLKDPGELEQEAGGESGEAEEKKPRSLVADFVILILALGMIVLGSKGMVDPVSWGASRLGVPTMIISATIVAFGTSVPELAVTVAGVLKKRNDIAIGNIIGSCIFNIFLILGVCALAGPLGINSGVTGLVNTALVIPAGILLAIFMCTGRVLVRWEGAVLLFFYLLFFGWNLYQALC